MTHLRQIVFRAFVLLYLVLCPLTILYALGYVLKPGTEHGITKTSVISLSTIPPGATIHVGRSRYTERTPAILRDVLPGTYDISLSLNGHAPWSRRVAVERGHATVLERILLLPQPLQPKRLLLNACDELISLDGTLLLLLAEGPRLGDLVVYHWNQQDVRPLLEDGSPWVDGRLLNWWTVPRSTVIVARVDMRDGVRMVWLDAKEKPSTPVDITDLVRGQPQHVMWSPWDRHRLFIVQEGRLSRVDTATRTVAPNLLERVRGLGVVGRTLYVLRGEWDLLRMDAEGRTKRLGLDIEDPEWLRALRELRGDIRLSPLSDTLLLFLADNGRLASSRPPYRLAEQGIRGAAWSENKERALVWQRDRIGIVEPAESPEEFMDVAMRASRTIPRVLPGGFQMERLEDAQTPMPITWIYRGGRAIEQAFWVYGDAYILFRDEESVFLMERRHSGTASPAPLVRVLRRTRIAYDDNAGTLYYVDPDGRLSSLQIIPRQDLLSPTLR